MASESEQPEISSSESAVSVEEHQGHTYAECLAEAKPFAWDKDGTPIAFQCLDFVEVFENGKAPEANDPNDYMITGEYYDVPYAEWDMENAGKVKSTPYVTLDITPQEVVTDEICLTCGEEYLTKKLITDAKPYNDALETVCCHLDENSDVAYAYKRAYQAVCNHCGETAYTEEVPDLLKMRICGGVSVDENGWIYTKNGPIGKRSPHWDEKKAAGLID